MLLARREADWRYVIDRRRSPCEVAMSVSRTSELRSTFSEDAMYASRAEVDAVSRGLKRNLEHREARGSMILQDETRGRDERVNECKCVVVH